MHQTISSLQEEFIAALNLAKSTHDVESLKVKYLGKKGPVQLLMQELRTVAAEERPQAGKEINNLKESIAAHLEQRSLEFLALEEAAQLAAEKIDIGLPGRRHFIGRKHIITQTLDEITDLFAGMGFSVQYGPEIDSDWYNFEALNFAPDHPARDMHDTFYLSPHTLLRTHTSNTQIRVMEAHTPPLRIIMPGRVYRNETITARSHVFFHQVEGMYVDKNVSFSDLKSTFHSFINQLFGSKVDIRFRPSYFPFVEPGMEVDLRCLTCNGSGCSLCKHTGWLEIAGAGMVHPEVLKNGGIDPDVYSGYAWGMGVERLILLKHGVKDIRLFTENDLRFVRQFGP